MKQKKGVKEEEEKEPPPLKTGHRMLMQSIANAEKEKKLQANECTASHR